MRHKINDEFTALTVSRQRKSQLRAVSDGKCMTCYKPRNMYPQHCDACFQKGREKNGHSPWRENGPGRPPHWFTKPIAGDAAPVAPAVPHCALD